MPVLRLGGQATQHGVEQGPRQLPRARGQRRRAADQPPWWLSVTVPVNGDFVTQAQRPLMLASLPVSGPFMKQRMLSGESGSTAGPASSA